MLRNLHCLVLFMALIVLTGCETAKGAATGLGQDVHNAADPDMNGWNAIQKADAWIHENMW